MSRVRSFVLASLIVVGTQAAGAAVVWDEGVHGDLSNDRLAPTPLVLQVGTNTIIGTTVQGDVDYFGIGVFGDARLTQIVLTSFTSADDLAFLAIQSGSFITETTTAPNVANLLGWTHPSAALVGTDILDNLAAGAGAIGFTPPLGPGFFSFWMQQTQPQVVGYSFDLVVVPEPSVAALLALGLGALAIARRGHA